MKCSGNLQFLTVCSPNSLGLFIVWYDSPSLSSGNSAQKWRSANISTWTKLLASASIPQKDSYCQREKSSIYPELARQWTIYINAPWLSPRAVHLIKQAGSSLTGLHQHCHAQWAVHCSPTWALMPEKTLRERTWLRKVNCAVQRSFALWKWGTKLPFFFFK